MSSSTGSAEGHYGIPEKHYLELNIMLANDSDNFDNEKQFYIEEHIRDSEISNLSLGTSVIRTS